MYSLFLYKFQGQEGSYSSGQYSEGKRVKRVQGQQQLQREFDTSLNYKISYLKEEKEGGEGGKEVGRADPIHLTKCRVG